MPFRFIGAESWRACTGRYGWLPRAIQSVGTACGGGERRAAHARNIAPACENAPRLQRKANGVR